MKRHRTRSRTTALLALATTLALAGAGCEEEEPRICADAAEVLHLKIAGSCPGAMQQFDLTSGGCRLSVANQTGPLGIPLSGALDQDMTPIRQGRWQIFGCLVGGEPCPAELRRCTATRVAWQLDLTCLDGTGSPVCEAVLTE
jgi:hypothetical protein